jgi:hypothetical protein
VEKLPPPADTAKSTVAPDTGAPLVVVTVAVTVEVDVPFAGIEDGLAVTVTMDVAL